MDPLSAVDRLVRLELEKVDALIALVSDASADELDYLGSQTDDGLDDYAEEADELFAIRETFSQLSAVALYAVVEIRTKAALGTRAKPAELKSVFKFAKLKELFAKYSRTTLDALPDYAAIDELRCLNNCFKHSGNVSSELAAYPGWVLDAPLGDVRAAVARLRPSVPRYLTALIGALR